MMSDNRHPQNNDAIIGGDAPAPAQAAVLGGLWQVQQRLKSEDLGTKFAAMQDCLSYGEAGVVEIIPFLEDSLPRTQWEAYRLLRSRPEPSVKQALAHYKFWRHFERLDSHPDQHIQIFANRQAIDFDAFTNADRLPLTALGFRENKWAYWEQRQEEDAEKKLIDFLTLYNGDLLEAIILGYGFYGEEGRDLLIRESSSLPNIKAIFLGDIEDREQMISYISQSDLSPLLDAYPALEVLHIRGDMTMWLQKTAERDGLRFSSTSHQSLTALIIETGGLSSKAIDDLCKLSLPSLEYLELWMGSEEHGSDSTVENLIPLLSNDVFPALKYLGLRNCEYADDIAIALASSPPREKLIELDLSMGTLTDEGAQALLNSNTLENLDTFNVSQCYLSQEFLSRLQELNCSVIFNYQRYPRGMPRNIPRYCVVGE